MVQTEKPRIEELTDELAFWNTFREVRRAKGMDIARLLTEWAAELQQGLPSPGAREEFAELCEAGCISQGLAALVLLLRYAPSLDQFWTGLVGQPSNRVKATHAIENAAQTLEVLYAGVLAWGSEVENRQFTKIGRVPISRIISELRFHIKFINFATLFSADTETRSPAEVAKYLLTGYVRRMTGRFHDRCVSGLVGEIVGDPEFYNEVAHRMWRTRNYRRLEKHYAWMVKFLVAMSVVIAHTA
ncbi:MAG: hypothetical protein ACRDHZ_24510 [Ktedonobacteraceae bacterium]